MLHKKVPVADVKKEFAPSRIRLATWEPADPKAWQTDELLPLRCPHPPTACKMATLIRQVKSEKDSIGGTVACVLHNVRRRPTPPLPPPPSHARSPDRALRAFLGLVQDRMGEVVRQMERELLLLRGQPVSQRMAAAAAAATTGERMRVARRARKIDRTRRRHRLLRVK